MITNSRRRAAATTLRHRSGQASIVIACLFASSMASAKDEGMPAPAPASATFLTGRPIGPPQRALSPAEVELERVELDRLYKRLDALASRNGLRVWQPPHEIADALKFAAPQAQIQKTGCGPTFCRYVIVSKNKDQAAAFAAQFSVNGSVLFGYPANDPLSVVAYVFRPGTDPASL